MKNRQILKGILAIVLVFGLIVIGCDNDTTDAENSQALKFIVTFDANGGTVSPNSMEVEEGKTLAFLPTPSKTDEIYKNFWGWYVDKDV
jgi:hypothetical protein